MTTVRRALALLVFCSAAPLPLATAQDPASDSPTASTQPRIHGRTPSATQDDLGPAPKFASKPPLDISGFSAQECAALIPQLTAYREYVNARTLWNLRKITSIGTGYFIEDCKEADEAFDKAADLAGSDTNSKAFKAAANDAFWKGSACRRDFDALFAQECSDSKDSECEAASIDKSQLDFLDDQNGKFKTDLIVREKEQGRLESCAGSGQTALLPPDKAALSSSQTQPSSQDQTISGKHSRDESLGKKRTGPSNNGSSTNGDNTSGQTSSKGQLGASDSQTSASSKKATSSNATGRTGAPAITLAKSPQSSGAGGKSQATPVTSDSGRDSTATPVSQSASQLKFPNLASCSDFGTIYNANWCQNKDAVNAFWPPCMNKATLDSYDADIAACNCRAYDLCNACPGGVMPTPDGKCSRPLPPPPPVKCNPPKKLNQSGKCVCPNGSNPAPDGSCPKPPPPPPPAKCTPPQYLDQSGKCVSPNKLTAISIPPIPPITVGTSIKIAATLTFESTPVGVASAAPSRTGSAPSASASTGHNAVVSIQFSCIRGAFGPNPSSDGTTIFTASVSGTGKIFANDLRSTVKAPPVTITINSRKADIAFVDRLVKKYQLDKCQRRYLHDLISGQGMTEDEIDAIAQDIARSGDRKCPKGKS